MSGEWKGPLEPIPDPEPDPSLGFKVACALWGFGLCCAVAMWCGGCALSHEAPTGEPGEPVWGVSVDAGTTGHPSAQGPHRGDQACHPTTECTPSALAPITGEHVYCPADHDWIPAMATAWGVVRAGRP